MSSETREKQALVVFLLLIVLGMSGLVWYLFAGHSWNVAASNIDDSVGQMEGYTAILYAGTMPEKSSSTAKSTSLEDSSGNMSADAQKSSSNGVDPIDPEQASPDSKTVDESSDRDRAADGETASGVLDGSDTENSAGGKSGGSALGSADAAAESTEHSVEPSESSESLDATAAGSSSTSCDVSIDSATDADSDRKLSTNSARRSVSSDEVRESYEEKGAGVLVLDLSQPEIYSEGTIVKRGERRIGVISITRPLNEVLAKRILTPFREAKVDVMVCIAPEKSYVSGISGFDVVVCTSDDSVSVIGETANKTFFVNAPTVGCVGATLVSPSNVVSAKVIDSL